MKLSKSLVLPVAAFCSLAFSSYGLDVVRNTFQDADRTDPASPVYSENGVDVDLDGDIESALYVGGTGSTIPTTPGHAVFTLGTGSANMTTYFTPEATPVTLANAGDSLRVTWVFTPGTVNAANTSQNFRFCVV